MSLPKRLEPYASSFAAASAETGLDPMLIAAICDRESGGGQCLTPKGPAGLGDNGHGHGLMQIDDRSWAQWLATMDWEDPMVNVSKGAEILNANLIRFEKEFDPIFCAVAAYNCGPGNVRAVLKTFAALPDHADPERIRAAIDRRTTGGNYASDVLARFERFKAEDATS